MIFAIQPDEYPYNILIIGILIVGILNRPIQELTQEEIEMAKDFDLVINMTTLPEGVNIWKLLHPKHNSPPRRCWLH